jgi:hypothetical protein
VLGGGTKSGIATFDVGLSRSQAGSPEAISGSRDKLKFVVYWPKLALVGALSVLLFLLAFALFAANSTLLRDGDLTRRKLVEADLKPIEDKVEAAKKAHQAAPADQKLKDDLDVAEKELESKKKELNYSDAEASRPAATFSLARTQMALWLLLSTAGFVFLWLTLGVYQNVITPQILVLLGISGTTGLAAITMNSLSGGQANPPPERPSKSFLHDLMSDAEGPKLHRIQVVGWTVVMAIIFIWNVVWNFSFVEFDTNMLLLIGIASSMYIGFKHAET